MPKRTTGKTIGAIGVDSPRLLDLEVAIWIGAISKSQAQQLISLRHQARLEPKQRKRVPKSLEEAFDRVNLSRAKPASQRLH